MWVSKTTTFTPLSRNRYRCNETDKVVKKARLAAHRNSYANRGRPEMRSAPKYVTPTYPTSSYSSLFGDAYCPTCDRARGASGRAEVITCICGTTFRTV